MPALAVQLNGPTTVADLSRAWLRAVQGSKTTPNAIADKPDEQGVAKPSRHDQLTCLRSTTAYTTIVIIIMLRRDFTWRLQQAKQLSCVTERQPAEPSRAGLQARAVGHLWGTDHCLKWSPTSCPIVVSRCHLQRSLALQGQFGRHCNLRLALLGK